MPSLVGMSSMTPSGEWLATRLALELFPTAEVGFALVDEVGDDALGTGLADPRAHVRDADEAQPVPSLAQLRGSTTARSCGSVRRSSAPSSRMTTRSRLTLEA
ncbi:hypothetical protein [Agrococcus sp. TSP3-2-1]|uniref:hypothetical protein n=1 Tax=Agrococcus sp. TSP3-2-1 TaxID=2804583 RepID=UPI003CFBBFA7